MINSEVQSNQYYSNPRAHFSYYEGRYKDYQTMEIWKKVLTGHPDVFRNKIVFEVGSGLGLFSLLAVKSGARHVYSWEPSSMVNSLQTMVKLNHADKEITVLQGPIEDISLSEKVDIIFTTNFGFGLFLDSFIPQFLYARDKFLKENGLMLPSNAELFFSSAVSSSFAIKRKFDWTNVYGFDFSPIENNSIADSSLAAVSTSLIKTTSSLICDLDFSKISTKDLNVDSVFSIKSNSEKAFHLDNFLFWFVLKFPLPDTSTQSKLIELDTSPQATDTYFHQVEIKVPDVQGKTPIINKNDDIHGKILIRSNNDAFHPILYHIEYAINDGPMTKLQASFS